MKLKIIKGQRCFAFDIIRNAETLELVSYSYNPDLTALFAAAPEMLELITDLSQAYDDSQSGHELASRLYDLRCRALRLLDKIEGGGE